MVNCGCDGGPDLHNSDYDPKRQVGRPVVIWPGWENFDSRASIQTDIMPLPIVPVHFQNWPEMQYQLSNGWQYTNYGQKTAYDDYLRMLYSSTSSPGAPAPLPGEKLQPTSNGLVSQKTLQNTVLSPNVPQNTAGAGRLNPGVSLAGRTYYG